MSGILAGSARRPARILLLLIVVALMVQPIKPLKKSNVKTVSQAKMPKATSAPVPKAAQVPKRPAVVKPPVAAPKPAPAPRRTYADVVKGSATAANALLAHIHGISQVKRDQSGSDASRLLLAFSPEQRYALSHATPSQIRLAGELSPTAPTPPSLGPHGAALRAAFVLIDKMVGVAPGTTSLAVDMASGMQAGFGYAKSLYQTVHPYWNQVTEYLSSHGPASTPSGNELYVTGSTEDDGGDPDEPITLPAPASGDANDTFVETMPRPTPLQPGVSHAPSILYPIAAPAAVGYQYHPGKHTTESVDTPYGPGIRLKGRQPIAKIFAPPGSVLQLSAVGTTSVGPNDIRLGVDTLGNRIAAVARLYERYHPHRCEFVYVPSCPTSTVGSIAFGLTDDPLAPNIVAPSFQSVTTYDKSVVTPGWQAISLTYKMHGMSEWLYSTAPGGIPSGNDALNRQSNFGALVVFGDYTNPGPNQIDYGNIFIDFDLILSAPTPDLGFTLNSEVVRLAGPGMATQLAVALSTNPVPFFQCLDQYCFTSSTPIRSKLDEEIERVLEARGLTAPYVPTPYESWLLKQDIKPLSDDPSKGFEVLAMPRERGPGRARQ